MNPLLKDIFAQAAAIVKEASVLDVKIGTAESCTGGLIGAAITAISGSSAVYTGSIVSYDNSVKMRLLDVPSSTIRNYGAVSEQTAKAMAIGAIRALKVDFTVSVTGVAGPGGGTPQKPVGTVWISIAKQSGGEIKAMAQLFEFGDIGRNRVRDETCLAALKLLNEALQAKI